MKQIIYPATAMLLIFLAIGCKKKQGDNVNLDPGKQEWYDFMSSKTGSYWRYAAPDGTFWTRHAREKDTMMLNKKYRYYERRDDGSSGYDPEYFGKNNSFYLTLIDLDGSRSNYIDYIYYKDSAVVTNAFTNTGEVNSPIGKVNITIESHVAEDNLTLNYGNNIFTNVLHVHSNILGSAGLIKNLKVGELDIWFKKGIGIIREQADINIMGQYRKNYMDSLIDYHIAP